jgi:hypothetical protein
MLSGGKNRVIILSAWSKRLGTGKYATMADNEDQTRKKRQNEVVRERRSHLQSVVPEHVFVGFSQRMLDPCRHNDPWMQILISGINGDFWPSGWKTACNAGGLVYR